MTSLTKHDYLIALDNTDKDPESRKIIEKLIYEHIGMIRHMKATSLWDVYEYEDLLTKKLVEPMQMVTYDNKKMRKEINELRKKLGMCEKYKTDENEED